MTYIKELMKQNDEQIEKYEKLINQCDEQIEKLIDVQKQMDTAWEYYTPNFDFDFLISVVAAYKMNLRKPVIYHD